MFLAAKQIEGCSERTISYYQTTVEHLLSQTNTNVRKITTEEMRDYLANYQKRNNCSNVTVDNVRRNILARQRLKESLVLLSQLVMHHRNMCFH